MSQTTSTNPAQLDLPEPVVPEGVDCVDGLTLGELDSISSALGCDVMAAISDQGAGVGKRYGALALVAHRWAKRRDAGATLDTFRAMGLDEITHALRMTDDDDDDQEQRQLNGDVDLSAAIEANPTDSGRA